jgi:hypothetical protein
MEHDGTVHVRCTPARGRSIFVSRDYARGEFVLQLAGPIVSTPTRYTIPVAGPVPARGAGPVAGVLFIDPVPTGNLGRYLNHSCTPSCGIRGRTTVVAFRDIAAGQEVTIDYAMIVDNYGPEISADDLICHCGSDACRGQLGAWNTLPETLRRAYRGYVSAWLDPPGSVNGQVPPTASPGVPPPA